MSALDRRVDPKVREVRRLEVINGALGHQARQGRLVLPAEELSFVPVVRTAAAEAPPVANSAPPAGIIEVALGDAVVRVPPAVDRRLLTKVLRRAGAGVILPGGRFAVFVATRAVDFRKRMDGLAAVVQQQLHLDPFCGAVFVFRAKRADRVKLLVWDGSGLTLIYKRLDQARFVWLRIEDGVMRLSLGQLGALFEGLDWKRVHSRRVARPQLAQ